MTSHCARSNLALGPGAARLQLLKGRPASTDFVSGPHLTSKDAVTALPRLDPGSTGSPHSGWRKSAADYVALTKPRIIELLLVTTFPTMFLAQRGLPPLWLIVATLVGGTLSAAAANVLNCYLDRDIDKVMHRTENRPLVTGVITPGAALRFGAVLALASTLWLGLLVNWLSAVLYLAAIVFFWTPPHYWPLSMRFKDEYEAAGVPMLPVVAKDAAVARQVVIYSWHTVLTSVALIPIASMGWIYLVVVLPSGGLFLLEAHRLLSRAKAPQNVTTASINPMRLFHYSISYLTLVFLAVAVDSLLHIALP